MTACRRDRSERGAALLLALVVLTLVATLASGMVWQQQRAVQLESAERARAQAEWVLSGALDWARLILREDARSGGVDHLGEPWATPLAEARLSTFLAADQENNTEADLDVFLAGAIEDAQARYNLRNLVDARGQVVPAELAALARLCDAAGVPGDTPALIAQGLRAAWAPAGSEGADANPPLAPARTSQLVWLGLDPVTVSRLEPWVTVLPVRTPVNVNTAPREVLLAAIDGLDLGTAERLVQARQRQPFRSIAELKAQLPDTLKTENRRVGVRSSFFIVSGQLRLEDLVLEEQSLVQRGGGGGGLDVVALQRSRRSLAAR